MTKVLKREILRVFQFKGQRITRQKRIQHPINSNVRTNAIGKEAEILHKGFCCDDDPGDGCGDLDGEAEARFRQFETDVLLEIIVRFATVSSDDNQLV